MPPGSFDIDLGDNHWLKFYGWHPDRELNPQYENLPDIDRCAADVVHLKPNGEECHGIVHFDIPGAEHLAPADHRWKVESWEPLTLSPSVLCKLCGDHGFVRNGRWVRA